MIGSRMALGLQTARSRLTDGLPQIIRIMVAACVSWQVCEWLVPSTHGHPPIFAAIVPLVAIRDQPYAAFNVSLDRLAGVVSGVCVGILTVQWLGLSLPAIALVLAAGLIIGVVLHLGPSLNIQVAASGLLVFANPDPAAYGFARLWETAVGAAITVVISPLLLPPNAYRHYRSELDQLAQRLTELINRTAGLADQVAEAPAGGDLLRDAHSAEVQARGLPSAFASADLAVARNPLRRRDRAALDALQTATLAAARLAPLVARLVEQTSGLASRPDLRNQWASVAAPLQAVLPLAAAATRRRLSARGDAPSQSDDAELAEANHAFRNWQTTDHRPVAAVLRHPVLNLLEALSREVLSN
jgi:uncharacterized membrane protein YgaE (UPF0421/DUF939 family)